MHPRPLPNLEIPQTQVMEDLPSISIPSSSETTVEAFPIVPTAVSEPVASPAEPVISSPTVEPEMPDEAPVFEPLLYPVIR